MQDEGVSLSCKSQTTQYKLLDEDKKNLRETFTIIRILLHECQTLMTVSGFIGLPTYVHLSSVVYTLYAQNSLEGWSVHEWPPERPNISNATLHECSSTGIGLQVAAGLSTNARTLCRYRHLYNNCISCVHVCICLIKKVYHKTFLNAYSAFQNVHNYILNDIYRN